MVELAIVLLAVVVAAGVSLSWLSARRKKRRRADERMRRLDRLYRNVPRD